METKEKTELIEMWLENRKPEDDEDAEAWERLMKKYRRKEAVKMAVSLGVGTCSCFAAGQFLNWAVPVLKDAPKGVDMAYRAVRKVGIIGMTGVVTSKVTDDTMQSLDAVERLREAALAKSRIRKEKLLGKEE